MSTVKRRENLLIDIFGKFLGFDFGLFTIRNGEHQIFVPTKIHPNQVWVRVKSSKHDGCCQVPNDTFSYKTCCDGITFNLNIESECCTIEWFATV